MTYSTKRTDRIKEQCESFFKPTLLNIIDESHLHAGHREAGEALETHFYIEIQSPLFAGKTPLMQHRMVMDLFKDEFSKGLHALRLKTFA